MYKVNEVLLAAYFNSSNMLSGVSLHEWFLSAGCTGAHNSGDYIVYNGFDSYIDLARMRFCS